MVSGVSMNFESLVRGLSLKESDEYGPLILPFLHAELDLEKDPQVILDITKVILEKNPSDTDDRSSSVVGLCRAYNDWRVGKERDYWYISGRDGGLSPYGENYITMRQLVSYLDGDYKFDEFLSTFR